MSKSPCKECGVRPKMGGLHRCRVCYFRLQPIGDRIVEAQRRLSLVPVELRQSRVSEEHWPAGERWCASCQSFVPLEDCRGSRCLPCASMATHGAMIEKTYGLSPDDYAELLKLQGGKCAICRARPVSKRLAVDHDHKTSAVRGLLCSRCNHDLMGSAWDSSAMALALWHYINTPPTSGSWKAPELGLVAPDVVGAAKPEADEFGFEDPTLGTKRKAGSKTAVPTWPGLPVLVLPDEWMDLDVPALHSLYEALVKLLRERDPAPF